MIRDRWNSLTREEQYYFAKYIANGCGAKGSVLNPPDYVFGNTSCKRHDYAWWAGGDREWFHKSNKGFYRSMLIDCNRVYGGNPWYHWKSAALKWVRGSAWRYYKAVDIWWIAKLNGAFYETDRPRGSDSLQYLMNTTNFTEFKFNAHRNPDPRMRE